MNTENKMINGLGQEEQRVQSDSCEEQRAIQPHTRCSKTGICNSVSQHPDVSVMSSAKATSTTRNALWACWLGEQSEDGLNTSTPLSQIFFFFFFQLVAIIQLPCSACCYCLAQFVVTWHKFLLTAFASAGSSLRLVMMTKYFSVC